MQGKGLVKFIFVILVLGCLYQLSFTWKTGQVESAATKAGDAAIASFEDTNSPEATSAGKIAKRTYLESKHNENVYNLGILKYTYLECKKRELNLGLDLQGGMSVVVEVSKYDMIKDLVNIKSKEDPKLIAALNSAREKEGKGQGNFVKSFVDSYEAQNPGSQLVTLFKSRDNDELEATATNNQVRDFIQNAANESFKGTYTKLSERIDKFGVAQASIAAVEGQGRIIIELPGVDNPKQIKKIIGDQAKLEFWRARPLVRQHQNDIDMQARLVAMDNKAKAIEGITTTGDPEPDTADEIDADNSDSGSGSILDQAADAVTSVAGDAADAVSSAAGDVADAAGNAIDAAADGVADLTGIDEISPESDESIVDADELEIENSIADSRGPLLKLIQPSSLTTSMGIVNINDTAQVNKYLRNPLVMEEAPRTKFLWSAVASETDDEAYELFALELAIDGSNNSMLSGNIMKSARQDFDPQDGSPIVTMTMNSKGASQWKKITADNIGRFIAIVLDDRVYSAPVIQSEIPNGSSRISGFDIAEAKTLATILETGKLPAKIKFVQEDIVGPSLGQLAIDRGLMSLVIGLILVLIFMVFYYNTGGIVADIALLANIFFVFGILATLGATLTLPGLAGIVLTVGMAVDANVIIFERIREELVKGKSGVKAIADGYKNSYSAILDANLTTLIVALVLNTFGLGPVKGFAIVLIIGILSSLFTAILVTRLVFNWMQSRGTDIKYYNSITKGAFKNIKYNFIGKRKQFYTISLAAIAIGIGFIAIQQFTLGVDFKGGRVYTIAFDNPVNVEDVRSSLQDNMDENVIVKSFSENNRVKLTTSYRIDESAPEIDSLVTLKVYEVLLPYYEDKSLTFAEWDTGQFKQQAQKVEPTIAKDIMYTSLKALAIALVLIFIYIVIRFRKWQFGLGAVAAIFHDVIIVLAIFSAFRHIMPFSMEIGETFIAAILTVIGYSINDTVVVFDRVREYLNDSKAGDFKDIVNSAIQSTLSRTLITSVTTIAVLLVLFIAGSEQIKGFSFAILIGILVGTYSSIFVATPIVVDFYKEEEMKKIVKEKRGRRKPVKA